MYQVRQSDYEFYEYDLETCTLITIHKFKSLGNKSSKIIESYDAITNEKEGYQILFHPHDHVTISQYKDTLLEEYSDNTFIKKLDRINIVHAAYDTQDRLVKIDLKIPIRELQNLEFISQNSEKIFATKNLLKSSIEYCRGWSGTIPNVHVQIYKNKCSSVEFVDIYDKNKFLSQCLQYDLLNNDQIYYVKSITLGNVFSIKFKWCGDILQRKMYNRVTK